MQSILLCLVNCVRLSQFRISSKRSVVFFTYQLQWVIFAYAHKDNLLAIAMAEFLTFTPWIKHEAIKYHHFCSRVHTSSKKSEDINLVGKLAGIPRNSTIILITDLLNSGIFIWIHFSNRKRCSPQFVTHSCRFGILSYHWFFQFHASENIPAFFLARQHLIYLFWADANLTAWLFCPPTSHLLVFSTC
jgi:hypothetical protein